MHIHNFEKHQGFNDFLFEKEKTENDPTIYDYISNNIVYLPLLSSTSLFASIFKTASLSTTPYLPTLSHIPISVSSILPLSFTSISALYNPYSVSTIASMSSAILFMFSLRGLNDHSTAKRGNWLGIISTILAIVSVAVTYNGPSVTSGAWWMSTSPLVLFSSTFSIAALIGVIIASRVSMEKMPELVASFHSFTGLAAVCISFANFFAGGDVGSVSRAIETFLGVSIGAATFSGSLIAAGKLHGFFSSSPFSFGTYRSYLNIGTLFKLSIIGTLYVTTIASASTGAISTSLAAFIASNKLIPLLCLTGNFSASCFLGALAVLPIGGADMPIVVSLLNSLSGLATSATGFLLSNSLLVMTGALVTSSGALLSNIMCKGINRPLSQVMAGGFGVDSGTTTTSSKSIGGPVNSISNIREYSRSMFPMIKRVLIVPGYGMATSKAQFRIGEISQFLISKGVHVTFGIHPVAGRLPGHMNVLLSEADVPYDIVSEMEDVNKQMNQYDLAIVIGANDICNPDALSDTSSPIYGMAVIEVWRARQVIVIKRSMATGYSGVDNPLFYKENTQMVFGDAKNIVDELWEGIHEVEWTDIPNSMDTGRFSIPEPESENALCRTEIVTNKTILFLNEQELTSGSEYRICFSIKTIKKLVYNLGFYVFIQSGAGLSVGLTDEYLLTELNQSHFHGQNGIGIWDGSTSVDLVVCLSPPSVDVLEGSVLSKSTFISAWSVLSEDRLKREYANLTQSEASLLNLTLAPRVSRAQRLDVLSSMANNAGYCAILHAFYLLPKFSRSLSTACGSMRASTVFVIGAGVAGLSAIATAHGLGATVYAADVRPETAAEIETVGGKFVPVIHPETGAVLSGVSSGGYATVTSSEYNEFAKISYRQVFHKADVIICTAQVPFRPPPIILDKEEIKLLPPGKVIIDLAVSSEYTRGNCETSIFNEYVDSVNGEIIENFKDNVNSAFFESKSLIVGVVNYGSDKAKITSEMLAENFYNAIDILLIKPNNSETDVDSSVIPSENLDIHLSDDLCRDCLILYRGSFIFTRRKPPPPPTKQQEPRVINESDTSTSEPMSVEETNAILKWLKDNSDDIAFSLGFVFLLTVGPLIPITEIHQVGYFILSILIGHFTVASVNPALHTPLISVTNAISGIVVVGGMLQIANPVSAIQLIFALSGIFFSAINISGGFAVTHRMLAMFRK